SANPSKIKALTLSMYFTIILILSYYNVLIIFCNKNNIHFANSMVSAPQVWRLCRLCCRFAAA
ncbi:MAG: hypothetical protein RR205_00815, partial [Oscillospiraceae bacterium]